MSDEFPSVRLFRTIRPKVSPFLMGFEDSQSQRNRKPLLLPEVSRNKSQSNCLGPHERRTQEGRKQKAARLWGVVSATASGIIQQGPSHEKPSPRGRALQPVIGASLLTTIPSFENEMMLPVERQQTMMLPLHMAVRWPAVSATANA